MEHAGLDASVHGSKKGTGANVFGGAMDSNNGMDLTVDAKPAAPNGASPKGEGVEEQQPAGTSAV